MSPHELPRDEQAWFEEILRSAEWPLPHSNLAAKIMAGLEAQKIETRKIEYEKSFPAHAFAASPWKVAGALGFALCAIFCLGAFVNHEFYGAGAPNEPPAYYAGSGVYLAQSLSS